MSDESRGLNISSRNKETGLRVYAIKALRSRKNKIQTETLEVPYAVICNDQEVASGTTNAAGEFTVLNLQPGSYEIKIFADRLIRTDTVVELKNKRTRIIIELDDTYFWNYADSVSMAKYPYTKESARRDIENGEVQILTSGLSLLSADESKDVTSKYGFKFVHVAGCVVNHHEIKAVERYNAVVYEYLDKINGKGWRENLMKDIFECVKNRNSSR